MDEEWRDVVGYEGYYQVSSCGRVRSLTKRDASGKLRSGKLRKQKMDQKGYAAITLCMDTQMKTIRVHRLVAQAFIPNPNNYTEVNHKDENKTNNCASNLEWCSRQYNVNYGSRTKKQVQTRKGSLAKGVVQFDLSMKKIKNYKSLTEASILTGVDISHISKCCKGKIKSSGGYVWRYET